MAQLTEVTVPDIGDFDDVPVIEILVSPGDRVAAEDPLLTLESDKATMDVPAPSAGVVSEIKVAVGDMVSQGTVIMLLDDTASAAADDADATPSRSNGADHAQPPGERASDSGERREERAQPGQREDAAQADSAQPSARDDAQGGASTDGQSVQVTVPDIGDFDDVPVIEILVAVGDRVEAESPLVTLESDKATMDVPAPQAGTVASLQIAVGDTVSQGDVILTLRTGDGASDETREKDTQAPRETQQTPARPSRGAADAPRESDSDAPDAPGASDAPDAGRDAQAPGEASGNKYRASAPDPRAPLHRPSPTATLEDEVAKGRFHATPAIRRFARDLGVDLARVRGTGRKGRILREDVHAFVKQTFSTAPATDTRTPPAAAGAGIAPIPAVDFSRFGEVEERKLSRIKRISGPFLQRAWLNVPHVTHHDEADVTELEEFRQSLKAEADKQGLRVTALAFILKAAAKTLARYPSVNSSLSPDGTSLILKKYFHIGIAVDTPEGLVVPVLRNVDRKGVFELAREMAELSARARDGKLRPEDMQGGCFSISSLGGIGGTGFTPIVNAPEVAILGVNRARMQPVWNGEEFAPRLMLPLDLSYDHRVIDGAEAARFVAHLGAVLGDLRRLLL